MLDDEDAEFLPEETLFSKTENGLMEKELFVEWLKHSVVPHKMKVNPDGKSLLILANHGSRFSTEAIDLCIANRIEILCYPGHLTHILQGPDVVLNKPLKNNCRVHVPKLPIIDWQFIDNSLGVHQHH